MTEIDQIASTPDGRRGIRDEAEPRLPPRGLAEVRSRARRYVRVLSRGGADVTVDFNTESDNSRTDGSHVVIGTDITESLVDSVLGLAIHEASHIMWSDFDFLRRYRDNPVQTMDGALTSAATRNGCDPDALTEIVFRTMNMVEDRRIDSLCYATRPGFRPYVHAVYKRYDQDPRLTEAVRSDALREETWRSYMFRASCITNEVSDPDALDALPDIIDAIGLGSIGRLESIEDAFDVACDVVRIMCEAIDEPLEDADQMTVRLGDGSGGGSSAQLPQGAADAFEQMIEHREGSTEKQPADKALSADIEDAAGPGGGDSGRSDVTDEPAKEGEYSVTFVRRLTEEHARRQAFPFIRERPGNGDAVDRGIRLGRVLADRLATRNERRRRTRRHLRSGTLDDSALHAAAFSQRLFCRAIAEEARDAFVHISLDASTSMRGEAWQWTVTCVAAIARACSAVDGVRVQVSLRATETISRVNNSPLIAIVYDSQTQPFSAAERVLRIIRPKGGTPEGLCYEVLMREALRASADSDAYVLNVSDGAPMYGAYSGERAQEHTRTQIDRMKRAGVDVLSYFVGNASDTGAFRAMYGASASFVDVTDIGAIARTMNRRLRRR